MKAKLELNMPDEGVFFLNFWNSHNGDDVVVELVDGKLMLTEFDVDGEIVYKRDVSIGEFFQMVIDRRKEQVGDRE